MTYAEAITALSTALVVDDSADAVASDLETRALEARGTNVRTADTLDNLAKCIRKREGADAQVPYYTPDVIDLIA
jgi:hypothetical protein